MAGTNKPSKKLSRYGTEKRCVGEGTTCSVYLYEKCEKCEKCEKRGKASSQENISLFAVKSFTKLNLSDDSQIRAIEKEVFIHSKVNDGYHVVKLVDYFMVKSKKSLLFSFSSSSYSPQHYFLILEYLPASLYTIYANYAPMLPQSDRLCYFKQIVNALHFLQSNNIGHRDLKLDNCAIDIHGNLKIIDFGSSTIGNIGYGMAGSPLYCAPEIYSHISYDSFKCDIWSLGVLLINLFYISKPKWKRAKYDDPFFQYYNKEPTIDNVIYSLTKINTSNNSFLKERPHVDNLILQLLTVNVDTRITLHHLIHHHSWFRQLDCCRHRHGSGHTHMAVLNRVIAKN